MRQKKGKVWISMLLVCALAMGILTGCKGDGKEENKKKAKGRYVEQMIDLPIQEDERGVSLIHKKEGSFKIYTFRPEEKTYQAYESSDGSNYTEAKADWLNSVIGGEDCYLKDIFEGEDGNEYLLYYKEGKMHLLKTTDGIATEEILPDVLSGSTDIEMVGIMADGNVITSNSVGKLEVYSIADGSRLLDAEQGSVDTTGLKMFDYRNGRAIVMNKEIDGFFVYDIHTGEVVQEFSYKNLNESFGILKMGKKEDCYFLNAKGLHHVNKDGSTVETMIEGDMASMGDAAIDIIGFALGEKEDYFALYNQDEGSAMLVRYVYDKNAKVTADHQLTVYGLEENKTVKQAISRFQKKHTDVRIHYKTGSQQETSTTKADQIRVLNTELLSGNGADVLILDGLPMDSYIEKGVLENMTDFYKELSKENPLLENIVESMKNDKKIYGMPVRARVLGLYGSKEEVEAIKSLKALSEFLDGSGEKQLLGKGYASFEKYLRMLLTINYKDLFLDSGKKVLPKENLKELLETAKKLGDVMSVEESTQMELYLSRMPDMTEESLKKELGSEMLESISTNNDLLARKKKQAVVVEAGGIFDLMEPCEVLKQMNATPQAINGLYLPRGIVGVNSASKNKELAQEFLEMLFSEEVQSLSLEDGFPVNEKALESWCTRKAPEDGAGISIGGTDENGEMFSASEPDGTQVQPFADIERSADTAVQIDDAILEVIINEGIAYFKGEKSLEETVQNITGKTETYLKE